MWLFPVSMPRLCFMPQHTAVALVVVLARLPLPSQPTSKQHTQFFLRSFSVSIITTQCSSTFPHNNNNHTQASPTHTEPALQHAGISCYFLFSETFSAVSTAARSHFPLTSFFFGSLRAKTENSRRRRRAARGFINF